MYWNHSKTWSPFEELRIVQEEMNRLFNGYQNETDLSHFPALNIWADADMAVVRAELPGLELDDLELNVVDNQLTIQGERKSDKPAEDAVCHRCERMSGKFTRTVILPFAVENAHVTADYNKGILTVKLPRHEATKPKRIEIKTA